MDEQHSRLTRPEEPARYVADLARGVERPFRDQWYPDLLSIDEAEWHNVFTLAAVFFEAQLRVRRRPTSRAAQVIVVVQPRLDELVGRPFPQDPDAVAGFGPFEDTAGWPQIGVLAHMGYRVGRDGRAVEDRRRILHRVFVGPIANVNDLEYMIGWGADGSSTRLHKMAWSLASFASIAQRRNPAILAEAIRDWIGDLRWLRTTYYEGHFGFPWPEVSSAP
jgi:hypothetical protein